jgi:hypothetical protein
MQDRIIFRLKGIVHASPYKLTTFAILVMVEFVHDT